MPDTCTCIKVVIHMYLNYVYIVNSVVLNPTGDGQHPDSDQRQEEGRVV